MKKNNTVFIKPLPNNLFWFVNQNVSTEPFIVKHTRKDNIHTFNFYLQSNVSQREADFFFTINTDTQLTTGIFSDELFNSFTNALKECLTQVYNDKNN